MHEASLLLEECVGGFARSGAENADHIRTSEWTGFDIAMSQLRDEQTHARRYGCKCDLLDLVSMAALRSRLHASAKPKA